MDKHLRFILVALAFVLSILVGISGSWEISNTDAEESPIVCGAVLGGNDLGLYSVSVESNSELSMKQPIDKFMVWAGVLVDGNYHAYGYEFPPWGGIAYWHATYDANTWEELQPRTAVENQKDYIYVMTYDVTTGSTYAISKTLSAEFFDDEWTTLSHYDLNTGTTKAIGILAIKFTAIAADPATGQLYGFGEDGGFYKINKETAETTLVGATGLTPASVNVGATFDKNTGKLYWTPLLTSNTSGLYEVNLSTGVAKLLSKFANAEQMTGVFIQYAPLSEEAPTYVSDLTFVADAPGALTGKIKFTVPSKTIGGENLTGNQSVRIQVGTQPSTTQSNLSPGFVYEGAVTIDKNGFIAIRVTTSNAAGDGQTTSYRFWAGHDYPAAVSNLLLAKNSSGKLELTWDASLQGENGGYVDAANLRYNIQRLPDNVSVATNHASNSFIDNTLPADMNVYSYLVTPVTGGLSGEGLISNDVVFGDPFTVPYKEEFESLTTFKLWNIIDANNDGMTWSYNAENKCAESPFYRGGVEDWLLSPAISLEAGTAYKLTYSIRANSEYNKENFKVTYGKSLDVEDQITVANYTGFNNIAGITDSRQIVVRADEAGEYHLGVCVYNDKSSYSILVDNIKLELLAKAGTPNAVTALNLKAGEAGAKTVAVSFNAPTTDIAGEALTGNISTVSIYRNDVDAAVKDFTGVALGANLSWTDTNVTDGMNYYRIVASNGNGKGLEKIDSVYVGLDVPAAANNLTLNNVNGDASLSWTVPTVGVHGGYVDQSAIKYNITRSDGSVIIEEFDGTSYIDNSMDRNDQNLYSYIVTYSNTMGIGGSDTTATERFGKAYPAPYYESFATSKYSKPGWTSELMSETAPVWNLDSNSSNPTALPQDDDEGMAIFAGNGENSKGCLTTPILDVSTVSSPILKFWFYHYAPSYLDPDHKNEMLIPVASKDGGAFVEINDTILINANDNGWTLYEIPLPQYKGATNLKIGFIGYKIGEWGNDLLIDNISVENQSEKDLRINSFVAPSNVYAGKLNTFTVEVKNAGQNNAGNYTVEIYNGKEVVCTKELTGLVALSHTNIECDVYIPLNEAGKTVEFRSEIKFEGNQNPTGSHISDKVRMTVRESAFKPVSELDAEEMNDEITLVWTAPANPKNPQEVFEDFESYEDFIIDNVGEWTMYDGDKQNTSVDSDVFYVPYPNKNAPMAYQVFNAHVAGVENFQSWDPHSGDKSLASFKPVVNAANDDWLISPLLPEVAQTIKFYAKGIQSSSANFAKFIVYYSTTDNSVESFIQLSKGNYVEALAEVWEDYEYELPQGTKYFAIRCVSNGNLTFLLDDITFIKAGSDINVTGFNVYRNGEKINSELLTSPNYTDNSPVNGINTYTVTAVYAGGESPYSTSVAINFEPEGINNQSQQPIRVYTSDSSIFIKDALNLPISVITIDGLTIHQTLGTGDDSIVADKGVYVVKVGNVVTKVIVR